LQLVKKSKKEMILVKCIVYLKWLLTFCGLAMWWYLKNVRPALLLIRIKKANGNKQIPIRNPSDQT